MFSPMESEPSRSLRPISLISRSFLSSCRTPMTVAAASAINRLKRIHNKMILGSRGIQSTILAIMGWTSRSTKTQAKPQARENFRQMCPFMLKG